VKTTVAELAALIGGEVRGDPDVGVWGVGSVDEARPGDVVVATDKRFLERAMASKASCVITGLDPSTGSGCSGGNGQSVIATADPLEAFSKVLDRFRGEEALPAPGIGVGAVVEPGAKISDRAAIGANCYVGKDAVLGDGCVLFPNVYVGEGASIGENSRLYPNVVVYAGCSLGKRVILHAGAVVGADGFGYTCQGREHLKLPHAGMVEIGDDVEIGANSTVDRAKTGATVIGSGTKIDNLVHIAHNCKIGRNCVIVALVGIAGSVTVGDNVTLAGQAGVKDHVTIGDDCVVAARAGVVGDLAKGSIVSGFPARDHRLEKRAQAARLHLPEMLHRLKTLEAEMEQLRNSVEEAQ
jgi:UDP-3-O-[3-hydroxymyristoyl] glucosamine N-acyltransferase